MVQLRPKESESERRFHAATKRIYAGRVRFVWKGNAKPGSPFGPGRWVMEERGRRGIWDYVWTVEGPAGEPRKLGSWVHSRIIEMDRYAMGLNPRAMWAKLSGQMDSGRLLRARRLEGHFDEVRETVRDKAAHRFGDKLVIPMNPKAVLASRRQKRAAAKPNENAFKASR